VKPRVIAGRRVSGRATASSAQLPPTRNAADRTRPITIDGFDGFDVRDRPVSSLVTMTSYDETFSLPLAFRADNAP